MRSMFALGRHLAAVLLLSTASACTPALAPTPPPSPVPSAWPLLKRTLPGTWTMATPKGPLSVTYKLVSGESALVEDWGAGTPHETESVFHPDGADLLLVHYCAQGNQPRLRATSATADSVAFSFVDVTNREPSQAMLVARRLRLARDAFEDTEVYRQPDGSLETTTYHFTRTDSGHDGSSPARSEVLHIPTGGQPDSRLQGLAP